MIYSYRHPISIARAKKRLDIECTTQKPKSKADVVRIIPRQPRKAPTNPTMFQMIEVDGEIMFWNGLMWQGTKLTATELHLRLGEARLTDRVALKDPVHPLASPTPEPKYNAMRSVEAHELFTVIDTALRMANIQKVQF